MTEREYLQEIPAQYELLDDNKLQRFATLPVKKIGKVSLLGTFDSDDPEINRIYADKAVLELFARGGVGHHVVTGIQPVVTVNPKSEGAAETDYDEVFETIKYLRDSIDERNDQLDFEKKPDEFKTYLSEFFPPPIRLMANSHSERKRTWRGLMSIAWRSFDRHLSTTMYSEEPAEDKSLVIVANPKTLATAAANLEEEHLSHGGIAALYQTESNHFWLTSRNPQIDLSSLEPRPLELMRRTGRLSPLFRDLPREFRPDSPDAGA